MPALEDNTAAIKENTEWVKKLYSKMPGGSAEEAAPRTRRGAAATESEPEKETTTRRRRGADPEPEKETAAPRRSRAAAEEEKNTEPNIGDLMTDFIKAADDAEDTKERMDFAKSINKWFKAERARDIPAKNYAAIERWMNVWIAGDEVDFEKD